MLTNLPLNQPRTIAFLVASLCVSGWLAATTLQSVIPDMLAQSEDIATVREALLFDSRNDRIQNQLGNLYFWTELDAGKSIPLLRRATEINPWQAQYWLDLGRACESAGDPPCADRAFAAAAQRAPFVPRFQLALAGHYLLARQQQQSLNALRRYFALTPESPEPVFQNFLRAFGPEPIWNNLPQSSDSTLQLQLITSLAQDNSSEEAHRYWTRLSSSGVRIPVQAAVPYLNALSANSAFSEIAVVWHDLQKMGSIAPPDSQNLVFNGNFNSVPSNMGLDWRYQPQKFISLDFTEVGPQDVGHSLRVDFSSTNADLDVISEIVPVVPETTYLLSASVRSQNIASDSGPRLRVQDLRCASCLDVATEGSVGTSPWRHVSAAFRTGPDTKFIRLSLWRPRSRSYPFEISGQFWISDVSLRASSNQ